MTEKKRNTKLVICGETKITELEFKELTEELYQEMDKNVTYKKRTPVTEKEWEEVLPLIEKFNTCDLTDEEADALQYFFSNHTFLVRFREDQGTPCDPNAPISIRIHAYPQTIPDRVEETPK